MLLAHALQATLLTVGKACTKTLSAFVSDLVYGVETAGFSTLSCIKMHWAEFSSADYGVQGLKLALRAQLDGWLMSC